ncbi:COBRA-like protein 4 [Platanthera zijinensis]|uniref:COBRA-like protein 4 n=1 Tax=Platanthera zijinensis TaxID=2320716 RepID=A0AAP0BSY9_9ASPA
MRRREKRHLNEEQTPTLPNFVNTRSTFHPGESSASAHPTITTVTAITDSSSSEAENDNEDVEGTIECGLRSYIQWAYDPLDPTGNITIKWDVISWTPDGYVAVVTMNNFQMYRHIMSPGWTLGWTWPKKEVIWSMVGAQTTEQGDCSKFKGNIPHCCDKSPTVVDLLPGVPYNQQIANCCKGGVVASWGQDPSAAVSAFQVSVGLAGTSNKTVKLPTNFTLLGPGPGYTCGPAKVVPSTTFLTPDRRRKTQALSKLD